MGKNPKKLNVIPLKKSPPAKDIANDSEDLEMFDKLLQNSENMLGSDTAKSIDETISILKSRTHKYKSKKPDGKGGWVYKYGESKKPKKKDIKETKEKKKLGWVTNPEKTLRELAAKRSDKNITLSKKPRYSDFLKLIRELAEKEANSRSGTAKLNPEYIDQLEDHLYNFWEELDFKIGQEVAEKTRKTDKFTNKKVNLEVQKLVEELNISDKLTDSDVAGIVQAMSLKEYHSRTGKTFNSMLSTKEERTALRAIDQEIFDYIAEYKKSIDKSEEERIFQQKAKYYKSVLDIATDILKATKGSQSATHKYYKREADGKGGFNYFYTKEQYDKAKGKTPEKPKGEPKKEEETKGGFPSKSELTTALKSNNQIIVTGKRSNGETFTSKITYKEMTVFQDGKPVADLSSEGDSGLGNVIDSITGNSNVETVKVKEVKTKEEKVEVKEEKKKTYDTDSMISSFASEPYEAAMLSKSQFGKKFGITQQEVTHIISKSSENIAGERVLGFRGKTKKGIKIVERLEKAGLAKKDEYGNSVFTENAQKVRETYLQLMKLRRNGILIDDYKPKKNQKFLPNDTYSDKKEYVSAQLNGKPTIGNIHLQLVIDKPEYMKDVNKATLDLGENIKGNHIPLDRIGFEETVKFSYREDDPNTSVTDVIVFADTEVDKVYGIEKKTYDTILNYYPDAQIKTPKELYRTLAVYSKGELVGVVATSVMEDGEVSQDKSVWDEKSPQKDAEEVGLKKLAKGLPRKKLTFFYDDLMKGK